MANDHPWIMVLAGLVLLAAGSDGFVRGATRLARRAGLGPVVIVPAFVAPGLSAPALFIAATAARRDDGDIAAGVVVGACVATIGCVLAVVALLTRLHASWPALRPAMPVPALAALAAVVVLADGRLGSAESVLLLVGLGAVGALAIRAAGQENALAVRDEFAAALPPLIGRAARDLAFAGVGLVLLVLGSRLAVAGAVAIARASRVTEADTALTILAVGASVPLLSACLVAVFRRQPNVTIALLVATLVFTLCGALGLAGVILPLRMRQLTPLDLGVLGGSAMLVLPFMKSGFRLQRWQGVALLAGYVAYIVHRVGPGFPN